MMAWRVGNTNRVQQHPLAGYSELGNNSLEPRFAGNSRNQVSVNRVTGDTVNRVTGDMVRFLGVSSWGGGRCVERAKRGG